MDDGCQNNQDDVEYLYLEVNAWLYNGTIYTNFNRAYESSRGSKDVVFQLYKRIENPDYGKELEDRNR